MKPWSIVSLSIVSALLVGGAAHPATAVETVSPTEAATPPDPVWIDDSDREAWSYTGAWEHASTEAWSAPNREGSESFSRVPGARATVQFTGTGFDLVGPRGSNGGTFRVTVDCAEQFTVTSFAPWKKFGEELLSLSGLPHGQHTVVVEVLGASDPGSSDKFVMIDGISVHDEGKPSPEGRWAGASGPRQTGDAVELRMPGCGTTSSLVDQLKARTSSGWFGVPGAGETWGAVNGHSVVTPHGVAGGPVITAGRVHEAATIPLDPGNRVLLRLTLPDAPRTALFTVAADERLGEPATFAVVGADGMVLPMQLVRASGTEAAAPVSEVVPLSPGEIVLVVVDLMDDAGVGAHRELALVAASASGKPAELDIFEGRTSHVSAARTLADFGTNTGTGGGRVPLSFFSHGPVVLSRVLADAGASAWHGDQFVSEGEAASPVPLTFGETERGQRLSVNGVPQPRDAIAVRLPEIESGSTSSARIQLETGRQCRTLTASVGIDDSTPARDAASVSIAAYSNGALLPLHHNGTWAYAPNNSINGHFSTGDSLTPVTMSVPREYLTEQLREAKLATGSHAYPADAASLAAFEALVNRQWEELRDTIEDPSMDLMTYPIDGPLVLGAGTNALLDERDFQIGELGFTGAEQPRSVPIDALDPLAAYPISVDLAEPHLMAMLRWAAQGTHVPLAQMQSPLAPTVDLVISGTPGATVVLAGAGLDCVATDVSTRVFPLWSQVGVRPAFLPTPLDRDGSPLEMLVFSPMWWDIACPAGVSSSVGLRFTAEKTRETVWGSYGGGYLYFDEAKSTEVATSTRSACTLPADQRYVEFGEFELADDSAEEPGDDYFVIRQDTVNPIESQLLAIDGSLSDRAFDWLKTSYRTTMEHPVEFAVWLAFAPFDLPAALAMNPFLMNALPQSVGVAAGLAFLPGSAVEGLEAAVAGGTRVASGATRPLESTNELLLGSTDAHAAEAAAGKRVTLSVPGGTVSIPARVGSSGEVVADVGSHTTSVAVVASDRAIARMPVVTDHAPWIVDETTEARAICSRALEGRCVTPIHGPGTEPVEELPHWMNPDAVLAPEPPVAPHAASSFWTRYPQAAAQFQAEVFAGPAAWVNVNASLAWQSLKTDAELIVGAAQAEDVMGSLRVGETATAPVAVSASTEPAYVFSKLPPEEVLVEGFSGSVGAWGDVIHGADPAVVNVWGARSPATIGDTVFVAATRDPDLFSSGIPADDLDARWYRYRIDRPQGGGIDLHASLSNPNAPHSVRVLAEDPVVRARADLLYFRIDPAQISHVHEIEYLNGRFQVVSEVVNDGFQNVPITPLEYVGAPVAPGQFFPQFDWWLPTPQAPWVTLEVTAEHLPEVVPDGSLVVFTKRVGWRVIPPDWGLTEQNLRDAGFVRGHWEATPFYPQTREVWVPAPGLQLHVGGHLTVDLEPGWVTTLE